MKKVAIVGAGPSGMLAGIKIKDFWGFIQANQMLDKLDVFSKTVLVKKY